jgi:hypothetical protein
VDYVAVHLKQRAVNTKQSKMTKKLNVFVIVQFVNIGLGSGSSSVHFSDGSSLGLLEGINNNLVSIDNMISKGLQLNIIEKNETVSERPIRSGAIDPDLVGTWEMRDGMIPGFTMTLSVDNKGYTVWPYPEEVLEDVRNGDMDAMVAAQLEHMTELYEDYGVEDMNPANFDREEFENKIAEVLYYGGVKITFAWFIEEDVLILDYTDEDIEGAAQIEVRYNYDISGDILIMDPLGQLFDYNDEYGGDLTDPILQIVQDVMQDRIMDEKNISETSATLVIVLLLNSFVVGIVG